MRIISLTNPLWAANWWKFIIFHKISLVFQFQLWNILVNSTPILILFTLYSFGFLAFTFYRIKHRVVVVLRFKICEYERERLFSIDKQQNTQTMHIKHQLLKICLFSFYFIFYSVQFEMWDVRETIHRYLDQFNFSRILFFSIVFVRTFLPVVVLVLISASTMLLIHR